MLRCQHRSVGCHRLGRPDNVAIYKDSGATMKVFAEDPLGGPKTVSYQVGALAAGSYLFRCDLHTEMKGTLIVK